MRFLEKLVRFLSELIGLKAALQNQAEAEGFEPSSVRPRRKIISRWPS